LSTGSRGAVAVAGELGPLQQFVLGNQPVELGVVDEVVLDPVGLAGTRGPRGDRHREPHFGTAAAQLFDDGALSYPGGTRQDCETFRLVVTGSGLNRH
jgi:hypothetical protein